MWGRTLGSRILPLGLSGPLWVSMGLSLPLWVSTGFYGSPLASLGLSGLLWGLEWAQNGLFVFCDVGVESGV